MKKFIKDNIAIVLAIILPLVLVAVFMASSLFYKVTVADPAHDFLIASNVYNSENEAFTFSVVNDRLVIVYHPPQKKNEQGYVPERQIPKLWRVNVPDMSVEEIGLAEPTNGQSTSINIDGITDITVRNVHPAPDGYEFLDSHYQGGGNLMTEIFASGRNDYSRLAIAKEGRILYMKIPSNTAYGSYNTRFIGWIIEK
jgi:hypothetical protein